MDPNQSQEKFKQLPTVSSTYLPKAKWIPAYNSWMKSIK